MQCMIFAQRRQPMNLDKYIERLKPVCKECGGRGYIVDKHFKNPDYDNTCPYCKDGYIYKEKESEEDENNS